MDGIQLFQLFNWFDNAREPRQGHSLLFITKSPGVSGPHFFNLGSMKG